MKNLILLVSLCLFSSVSWGGCVQGNCTNGQGTMTWTDGQKYVGQFNSYGRNGQGTYTWPDGRKYVGQWKDQIANGQGTFTWPDGRKYVGQWKDDKINGQGTYTWPDGNKYVGQFKDDGLNGQGTYTWPNGNKYVGQHKDDKRNGQGTFTWADGSKYVGQWKDDKRTGQGVSTYLDGRRYVGQFKDDSPIPGQGKDYLPDGRQLHFNSNTTQLFSANGQLVRSNIPNSDLDAIRAESAINKRRADQRLGKEQQKKDRQLAEQRRRDKKEIVGIQRQLIVHKYLRGSADGIPGNKTSTAVKAFYRDAEITRPALDDYTTIAEDLSWKLLSPYGNCPNDSTSSSGFSVCFTIDAD